MAFTTAINEEGGIHVAIVCDACEQAVGKDGRVAWGPRRINDLAPAVHEEGRKRPPFTAIVPTTSPGPTPPFSCAVACSVECHIKLFGLWEDQDEDETEEAEWAVSPSYITVADYVAVLAQSLLAAP